MGIHCYRKPLKAVEKHGKSQWKSHEQRLSTPWLARGCSIAMVECLRGKPIWPCLEMRDAMVRVKCHFPDDEKSITMRQSSPQKQCLRRPSTDTLSGTLFQLAHLGKDVLPNGRCLSDFVTLGRATPLLSFAWRGANS